jgi:sulfur relay (sulfurtransferase) DsrC/TusE family protein
MDNVIALLGIVEGMTLMYVIELLREFYNEYRESIARKEIKRMLKSVIPPTMTSTAYNV